MRIITVFAQMAAFFVFITGIGTLATNKNPPDFYRYLKTIALKPFVSKHVAYPTNRDPLQLEWEALQFLKSRRHIIDQSFKRKPNQDKSDPVPEEKDLLTLEEFYKNTIK